MKKLHAQEPRQHQPQEKRQEKTLRDLLLEYIEVEPEWVCPDCKQKTEVEVVGRGNEAFVRCDQCRATILRPNRVIAYMLRRRMQEKMRKQFEAGRVKKI